MSQLVSLLFLLIVACATVSGAAEFLIIDDFEHGLSSEWRIKEFKGKTDYQVVADGTTQVLQAKSEGSASGLVYQKEFLLEDFSVVSWRWKIEDTVEGGDYRQKISDDFAARIYVTFPHWFFPKTTSLNYIWANQMPRDEIHPNAFTGNAMMIAVESGKAKAGTWVECRRNIVEDYRRAFGEEPPAKAVIAIMTDTDNTGKTIRAWYDDIRLEQE